MESKPLASFCLGKGEWYGLYLDYPGSYSEAVHAGRGNG
ncbi:hypothetical protein HM1_1732 [Heliomicrobium modesticaldum Ice1]|uniref:Uncharacterized protein n=1 Tax=Heliobacterium modesticaldum (strain ATCC 51547 / Ice1) TaxID=498761 RepID=B0TEQ0_HELMI|nr:hypothetical protein HM1_1732 [Heliomicrobium modesticaldum Ice1]